MEFNDKEINEFAKRLVYVIGNELDKTRDMGPANHLLALTQVAVNLMLFFETESGGKNLEHILDFIREDYLEKRKSLPMFLAQRESEKEKNLN